MNVKRASALISLILVAILLGLVIADIGPKNQNPVNNSSNETDNQTPNKSEPEQQPLAELPDGLILQSGDLVVNNTELIRQHNRRLSNNSIKVTIEKPTGTKTIKKEGRNILLNDTNFVREIERFSNGDYSLKRTKFSNTENVSYSANVSTIRKSQYTYSSKISTLLSNLPVTGYDVRNDSVRVNFYSNSTSGNIALEFGMNSVDEASMEIIVDKTGYIRSANISVTGSVAGGVPTVKREKYRVNKFGEVSVNRPDWAEQAENVSTLMSGVLNAERDVIQLNHRGLQPLGTEDEIQIVEFTESDIGSTSLAINQTVAQGETIYLRPIGEGSWEISYGTRPDAGERELSNTIVVSGGNPDNDGVKFEIEFQQ